MAARSTTGQDVKVYLQRHSAPYTNYGLIGWSLDLSADWQFFETEFTTANFNATTTDSRLRIWMAESNIPGESYYFDRISLVPISAPSAPAATETPTETATALPTATDTPTQSPTDTAVPTDTPVPTDTSTPVPSSTQPDCRGAVGGNVLQNPGFEEGEAAWTFFSDAGATFTSTTTNPYDCARAAEVSIRTRGSNVQLYQTGMTLQPGTTYRLSMAARSTTGQDVKVYLQRHSAPYTSYWLNGASFDLSADWQYFETEFTTANFNATTTDSRLRIWMAESNIPGESYYFDRISLVPISAPAATATPTHTATPPPAASSTPTATSTPTSTTTPVSTSTATPTTTLTTVPTATPTATQGSSQGQCAGAVSGNVLQNPGFEEGEAAWTFFSDAGATFTSTTTNPYDCARAAEVSIRTKGSNVQLYQTGMTLQPGTTYRLSMAARSTTGQDVKLFLQRHSAPYTSYWLNGASFDLSADWQFFETEFTTVNFNSTTTDSRLRIWMAESNIPGESYYFDRISLVPISAPAATATPTHTATPPPAASSTPTATSTPTSTATPVSTSTATPTATQGSSQGQCAGAVSGNVLLNPGFEEGETAWAFFSNATAEFITTTINPYDCARAAEISIQTKGSNVQLYQVGVTLQPATTYRLSLAARSSTGQDVKLFLQQHSEPYTGYGLSGINLNLSPNWQTFSIEFNTSGFVSTVNNGRLRISLDESNIAGEVYYLDQVSLVAISSAPQPTPSNTPAGPTPTPTNTPVGPTPTPTNTPGSPPASNTQMVAFDWNQVVTTANRGFPWELPPRANGNWISPVNYAEGTLHYRAEIRSMPTNKDMKLQLCIWQEKNGDNFGLENCGIQQPISYKGSRIVVTWSQEVQKLWMKGGKIIEWHRPRYRTGVAIKTPQGVPVSDFSGWNWNGENPAHWYPMNLRFTVVVVAKGQTFSGWENYP